jgi:U3 small nucleolar RNA-associated protein 18
MQIVCSLFMKWMENSYKEAMMIEEETKLRKPVWAYEEEENTNRNIAQVNRLRKPRKDEDI